MNAYSYIESIKGLMSAEDVRFYSDVWAPVEVAVPDADAWDTLCVMPDGEIRCYGHYKKENVFQRNLRTCYLASCDGGLSWKRHMVDGRSTLGRSSYVPYLNKYVAVKDMGSDGTFLLVGDTPDDENPMRILITEDHIREVRGVFTMRSRDRVIIVVDEPRTDLHPTAFFASLYIADGDLLHWKKVTLEAAPFYQPTEQHKGVRWQQNNRENTIEELSDGRLMMISRTSLDHHHICFSDDGGDSWTHLEPSAFYGTGTMPCLKRLSDGKIVFVWCNTRLLPELDTADGIWEDVFTNRDALHAAISEDEGASWIGWRELALNPHRNAVDFRSLGGPEEGRDKSVHQAEILELPYGKLLIAYGQNYPCRRLVILDRGWLYEKRRTEDFIHGLASVSAQGYVKSVLGCYTGQPDAPLATVGHCAYNRISSALLVPDPIRKNREALQICRNDDPRLVSGIGGATWNFPASRRGTVRIPMCIFGEGVRVSLLDHWVNPTDEDIKQIAPFSGVVTSAIQKNREAYTELRLVYDCDVGTVEVFADNRFLSKTVLKCACHAGLSYVHVQSAAKDSDLKGTLIAGFDFDGE